MAENPTQTLKEQVEKMKKIIEAAKKEAESKEGK